MFCAAVQPKKVIGFSWICNPAGVSIRICNPINEIPINIYTRILTKSCIFI